MTARGVLRGVIHLAVATIVLLVVILPRSRYDWVADAAPGIDPADLQDPSGDTALVVAVLVIIAFVAEICAAVLSRTRGERRMAVGMMAIVLAALLFRTFM